MLPRLCHNLLEIRNLRLTVLILLDLYKNNLFKMSLTNKTNCFLRSIFKKAINHYCVVCNAWGIK